MPYCEKCGKSIKESQRSTRGLCPDCQYTYLMKKIDMEFEKRRKPIIYEKKPAKKIISYIRYWLNKIFK